MFWFELSLAAALIWSLTSIMDKHVISDEMKDPIVAVTVAGFSLFLPLCFFSLIFNPLSLPPTIILTSFLAGITYSIAILFLYKAAKMDEISRVLPLIKMDPLLVLLFSVAFLGEILSPVKYSGILLLIAGELVLTFKRKSKKRLSLPFFRRVPVSSLVSIALLSAFFYSVRSILLEFSTEGHALAGVLFWVGIGGLLVGSLFLAAHHPHIRRKAKKGIEHLFLSNFLTLTAFLLFAEAVSLGPVSLASAVVSTNILFVFLISSILSRTHTHLIREEMRGSTLLMKGAGILLVLVALFLIL